MEQKYEIKRLSLELRARFEKEILDPLVCLETVSGSEKFSLIIADKVFKDFRKIDNGIWEELHQKINNGNGKAKS